MEIAKRKHNLDMGIISLWMHWVIGTGALVLPILLSLWVSLAWLPVIILIEIIGMYYYIQSAALLAPRCYLIINVCAKSLILACIIMIVINLGYTTGEVNELYDQEALNPGIPYICVLIIAPCAFLFSFVAALLGRRRITFCQNCIRRYGTTPERGFIGFLYKKEGHMQMVFLAWLTGAETIYSWLYYFFAYINVNLNSPDIFFFIVLPVAVYVLSCVYTGLRYLGLLSYYSREIIGTTQQKGAVTEMRFAAICGDSMFLAPLDPELENTRLDTPFRLTLRYRKDVSHEEAVDNFCNLAHVQDAKVRFIYVSESGNLDGTIRHYTAMVDSEDAIDASRWPFGKWYNFYEVKFLLNNSGLAPILAAEIVRVYTISMARKTYDSEGKRLYKIKNYRPTFKMSHVNDLDVDYNDNRWLFISANNEDRPFFRLRRFYHKLFYGRDI